MRGSVIRKILRKRKCIPSTALYLSKQFCVYVDAHIVQGSAVLKILANRKKRFIRIFEVMLTEVKKS